MNHYDNFGLRIDGVTIPPPSGYSEREHDLSINSERNAQGYARWDVVRTNVSELDLTWDNLDGDRLKQVIAVIDGKKQFQVTYFDALRGVHKTKTFYAGSRSAELARYISAAKYWATLTVPFVEV